MATGNYFRPLHVTDSYFRTLEEAISCHRRPLQDTDKHFKPLQPLGSQFQTTLGYKRSLQEGKRPLQAVGILPVPAARTEAMDVYGNAAVSGILSVGGAGTFAGVLGSSGGGYNPIT